MRHRWAAKRNISASGAQLLDAHIRFSPSSSSSSLYPFFLFFLRFLYFNEYNPRVFLSYNGSVVTCTCSQNMTRHHLLISPLSTFSADNFLPRERVPRQRRSTSSSDLFPFRLVCIPWRDFDIFNRSGDANASAAPAHQLFSLSHSLCGQRCQRRPFCCAELGLLEKNTHTQVTTPKVPHYISCVCRCIAHVCGRASTPVAIAGFCFSSYFPTAHAEFSIIAAVQRESTPGSIASYNSSLEKEKKRRQNK